MRTPTTSLTRTFVLDRYAWTNDEFVFMDEVAFQINSFEFNSLTQSNEMF